MEWLSNFAGVAGIPVLLLVLIIIVLLLIAIKKGYISFNGHGLKVGDYQDKERTIIRNQMQFISAKLDGTVKDIPARLNEGLHHYRTKYIIGKVKDLFEEMIIYNHINDSPAYVAVKQEMVYSLVIKLTEDDFFKKPQFKDYIYKLVEDCIKSLISIREQSYGK